MANARRLTAQLLVDGATLSGVVTDEEGRTRPFHGWLELIALLQGASDRPDDDDPRSATPPARATAPRAGAA